MSNSRDEDDSISGDIKLAHKFNQALLNNETLFTDMVNIFHKTNLPGHNSYQIVVIDKADKFIFQYHYQNVLELFDSNIKPDRHKIVNVNMASPQPNSGNVYTIPRECIGNNEYLIFSMNDLIIQEQQQQLQPTDLSLTELALSINHPHKLTDKVWALNPRFTPIETFKLLLQMLSIVDINITEDMYTYVKQPLSNYSLYRHIMIYKKDQGKLNPYAYSLPFPELKNTYTPTGIPLNGYP